MLTPTVFQWLAEHSWLYLIGAGLGLISLLLAWSHK